LLPLAEIIIPAQPMVILFLLLELDIVISAREAHISMICNLSLITGSPRPLSGGVCEVSSINAGE
jgi:hypothetical protein